MLETFPANDLDRVPTLMAALGSFWTNVFQGTPQVEAIQLAKTRVHSQNYIDFLELIASISRLDTPVYHRDEWYYHVLKRSERNRSEASLLRYGAGASYGDAANRYGESFDNFYYRWPKPSDLVYATSIFNKVVGQPFAFHNDVDFAIEGDELVFRVDPYETGAFEVRDIFQDGAIVDQELGVWIYQGLRDWQYIYRQWGYVLGLQLQSSEEYKKALNVIFDAITTGTSDLHVRQVIGLLAGIRLVEHPQETVEYVITSSDRRQVITDKTVYTFGPAADVIVQPGAVVKQGDSLVSDLQFFELHKGIVPTEEEVPLLTTDSGYISAGYFSSLVWENKEVPLIVEENVDGFTKLSWEMPGWPGDVDKLFDDIHQRGIAAGKTFAHYLDQREEPFDEPFDEPIAIDLPKTVNPMELLVSTVFRKFVTVAKLRLTDTGFNAMKFYPGNSLRKIIPPHAAVIIQIYVSAEDYLDNLNITEELTPFYVSGAEDTISGSEVSDTVNPQVSLGNCL